MRLEKLPPPLLQGTREFWRQQVFARQHRVESMSRQLLSGVSAMKSLPPTGQDCSNNPTVPESEASSGLAHSTHTKAGTWTDAFPVTQSVCLRGTFSLCLPHAGSHLRVVEKHKGCCFVSGSPNTVVYEIETWSRPRPGQLLSLNQSCQVQADRPHLTPSSSPTASAKLTDACCSPLDQPGSTRLAEYSHHSLLTHSPMPLIMDLSCF